MPKILLVEDNEMNRDMLSRRLIRMGYDVTQAFDGLSGVEMTQTQNPDLVLMDLSLPILDGWEATRRLKANSLTQHIPIIGLTAHAMSSDREKALEAGCNDYDTKPVELPRLLAKIQALLIASKPAEKKIAPPAAAVVLARQPLASELIHDLRTPLNQIIGFVEILLERALDESQHGFVPDLHKAHSAGQQLLALINERFYSLDGPDAPSLPAASYSLEPSADFSDDALAPEVISDQIQGRVLIVDDVEANRDVLARRLERQGHLTSTAENGKEALARLRSEPFDLVLLDIMMPELDGYEVLQRLKDDPTLRSIPVIMISALSELNSVVRCIELGAEDYLPKPFNPILLKARIGACLEKKRAHNRELQLFEQLQELATTLHTQNSEMTRWREVLEADLAVARSTQQALISSGMPRLDGWQIDATYRPLIQVGGDIYGWRQLQSGVWMFWLVDATGHGVAAALLTTLVALIFDHASASSANAAEILSHVNREFYSILQGNSFMTACCAIIDRSGHLSFAGAGHPPLLIRRVDSKVESLLSLNAMIGIKPEMNAVQTSTNLNSGDTALLYTDGLYSLKATDGERFIHTSVPDALTLIEPGADVIPRLIEKMIERSDAQPFDDDLAVIALQRSFTSL